jgi:hypothetical protein
VQAAFDGFDTCLMLFPFDAATADATVHSQPEGLVARLVEDVFGQVKVHSGTGRQFLVELSLVQVGADKTYDLLSTKATRMGKPMPMKPSELDSGAVLPDGITKEVGATPDVLLESYHRGRGFLQQLYEVRLCIPTLLLLRNNARSSGLAWLRCRRTHRWFAVAFGNSNDPPAQ